VLDSFGWRIAEMVDRLTRDRPDGTKLSVEEILHHAYEKNDTEVILIKIFDRLHNISTASFLPIEKQKEKIAETIKNFLILAEELSLSQVGESLYQECLKLNIGLGVVCPTDIKKRRSTFNEEPVLPFPTYQNI
jgi:guanosine-3',5'-bis(diphosphate) 3'-pyrophosphohydrolase